MHVHAMYTKQGHNVNNFEVIMVQREEGIVLT